jgi:hypothetical protein
MVTKCASFVKGRRMRVTRLDGCGRPIYGADSQVVSKGFVSIAYTANTDEGEEINVPNASGERCIYEPATPSFLGYSVEITFCNVDPDLFAMLTGQEVTYDAEGNVDGFTMDTAVSITDTAFALEAWTGSPSTGGCAEGAEGNFGYVLLPFVQGGVLGDFTLENAEVTFTVSGAATKDGNGWGSGPYNVELNAGGVAAPLLTPLTATKHLLLKIVGVAPPEAACGARPLLEADGAALTGVTATPDEANGLEVTFAPAPVGTDPWWIDFGDGIWDYSETGGNIVHTYEAAGTYTYTAFRGSSTFSASVTVTA